MVGPGTDDEMLRDPPTRTYLCGMLHPPETRVSDEQNDELQEGDTDSSLEGIPSLINAMNPSAMGFTFHVKHDVKVVKLRVELAFYRMTEVPVETAAAASSAPPVVGPLANLISTTEKEPAQSGDPPPPKTEERWQRHPLSSELDLPTEGPGLEEMVPFKDNEEPASGLVLDIRRHPGQDGEPHLLTITLVNKYEGAKDWQQRIEATVFQPCLEVRASVGGEREVFVEPSIQRNMRSDPDYPQHLLLYRHARDLATGHGCAADWERASPTTPAATRVWTEFLPTCRIPELGFDLFGPDDEGRLATEAVLAVFPPSDRETDPRNIFLMKNLAGARSDAWILAALEGLCKSYEGWLTRKESQIEQALNELRPGSPRELVREKAARFNLSEQNRMVLARMRAGIATLKEDALVFRCFRLTCEVMHEQQVMSTLQSLARNNQQIDSLDQVDPPRWRPFQLAFLLLTLNGITRPDWKTGDCTVADRDLMDLIWFPTGGGKTEAYLGLTALTLLYRRLRQQSPDQGAGVSVITRYTLRLLTTQQCERAARLLCALEVLRTRGRDLRGATLQLGSLPMTIGLWIGGSSTPNRFTDIESGDDRIKGAISILVDLHQGIEPQTGPDVRQVRACPWCGTAIPPRQMRIESHDGTLLRNPRTLPTGCRPRLILQCNGKLPRPLEGKCPFDRKPGLPVQLVDEEIYDEPPSVLIGTVDKFARLIWSSDARSLFGWRDGGGRLPVPDLIIQDELHLISGPLGTMVGQFESVVEALTRQDNGRGPKIVGSTATIRRASEQVRGLFNREVRQFPPSALTAGDSFFARTDLSRHGRVYLGIMAPGTSGKTLLLRVMGAHAQLGAELPEDVRDPYWSLVTYFNSLRELGGASVLAQDDVPTFVRGFVKIRQRLGLSTPQRSLSLPVELTSRRKASEIPAILQQLQQPFQPDLLLATNMISVGVDVDRLGLMAIQGQPKTTSEYIQASSRVGRKYPGLVVTLLNWTRSRDRSHYERFVPYHEAVYREVEASSVTPWSSPTRDRLLSGVMIGQLRNLDDDLVNSPQALRQRTSDAVLLRLQNILDRVGDQDARELEFTRKELEKRIRYWLGWAGYYPQAKYGWGMWFDRGRDRMLRQPTAPRGKEDGLEPAPNSMRTVEPETGFFLRLVGSRRNRPAVNPIGGLDHGATPSSTTSEPSP
jgi:hypothetical protein